MQIKVNLKLFIFLIIFILTHQIEIYGMLMLFAFIHELGHLLAGVLLKLKPKKMTIMPFGISIVFEEYCEAKIINIKKMIIAIAGPLTNIAIAIVFFLLKKEGTENIIYANIIIALFNLLPIYPLDGGRILKSALKMKMNSRESDKIIYGVTNISLIVLTIIGSIVTLSIKNIAFAVILAYLWSLIIKENRRYELKERIYRILEGNK